MNVQSIYSNSGLSPLREPAGAWGARLRVNTKFLRLSRRQLFRNWVRIRSRLCERTVRLMFYLDRRIRNGRAIRTRDMLWRCGGRVLSPDGRMTTSVTAINGRTGARQPNIRGLNVRALRIAPNRPGMWSVLHNACLPPRRNLNSASGQQRDEHWAIVDLVGKAAHIRTVPVPGWVKAAVECWLTATPITGGRVFRCVSRKR